VVGAVFTTLLPEALRFSNQLREILMGGLVLAIVLYLPGGALSVLKVWRRADKSRSGALATIRVKP
jgi:branched-chain amino acid transport system permease protein